MNAARSLSWSVSLLLLLASAHPAAAQSDAEYQAAMHDGEAELEAQHYPEARALFLRARGMHDDSRALVRLGQTEFEMREYVDCVTHLRAALADTAHPVRAARDQVTALLGRARAFVGEYRLELQPAGATLTVDDEPTPTTGPLLLAIGTHALVLRADGHEDLRRTVRTAGGEDEALTLALSAATSTPTTSAVTIAAAAPTETAEIAPRMTPPPEAGTVRIHVESTTPGLGLHRVTGTTIEGFDTFALLCAAPCDAHVAPGNYTLGVSSGSGTAQRADHSLFTFDHDAGVQISYESRDGLRIAGGVVGLVGLFGGIGLLVAGAATSIGGTLSSDNVALMAAGGAVATVGLVVGIALLLLSDVADVQTVDAD